MTHHQRILALGALAALRAVANEAAATKAAPKPKPQKRERQVKRPLGDPRLSPDDVLDRIDRGLSSLILPT